MELPIYVVRPYAVPCADEASSPATDGVLNGTDDQERVVRGGGLIQTSSWR